MVMSQEKTLLPDALPREIVQQIRTDNYNTPNYPQSTLNNSRSLKREEEKNKIIAALQRHNGNQTAAAKELGISRVTLWRKKTMYNI
jgi:transcriptional regulator of acetoin/glycerol metabolism